MSAIAVSAPNSPRAMCHSSLEVSHFDLHAVVALRTVSALSSSTNPTEIGGYWRIHLDVPAVGDVENKIWLYRNRNKSSGKVDFTDAIVEFKTKRLFDEEVICKKTYTWVNTVSSSQTFSYPFWDKIWLNNPDVRRDDGFRLEINIKSAPTPRQTALPPIILRAISQISKGQGVDINLKFFAFSRHLRRDNGTGAQDPLPIYAASTLLSNSSDYFKTICESQGFLEARAVDYDELPFERKVDEYDYDSDSDLSYCSDREDDIDGADQSSSGETGDKDEKPPVDVASETSHGRSVNALKVGGNDSSPGRTVKVITIKDTAYVTWKAMLFFVCTSEVAFAPLSSCNTAGLRRRNTFERQNGFPPKASPKSMYRVADKLDLASLAKLAFENIETQLTTENIIKELFSSFTSRYDEIKQMELKFAFKHWNEIKTSPELFKNFTDTAYCREILGALLAKTVMATSQFADSSVNTATSST